MKYPILLLLLLCPFALAKDNDCSISFLREFHFSKARIVKTKKMVDEDVLKVPFKIEKLLIKEHKDYTAVSFNVKYHRMQFNLHPEVGLYVFAGKSPETAQLVGISQHDGEVNLKLGMLHKGMKLYLGGQGITLMELKVNPYSKVEQVSAHQSTTR